MKQWCKRTLLVLTMALMAGLSAGCAASSSGVEELFTLPKPPLEYEGLSHIINQMIYDGYEYASPTSGENIQSVQMVDLDGDDVSEAVAFFRKPGSEKQLQIMVFSAHDETYEELCTIESSGTAIDSVHYQDMNDDGVLDLVVGWKISADLQTVAVYTVGKEPAMLMQNGYTRYSIQDMNEDGVPSLLLFRANTKGESVAEFYGWREDAMELVYSCSLSSTMVELNSGSIVSGLLDKHTPAVFVTGVNDQGMAVTDILVCQKNGTLSNAALNGTTGLSDIVYPYCQLDPQDINGDGIIEVPAPQGKEDQKKRENDGLVRWLNFDADGESSQSAMTYHCSSRGWYFTVPQAWEDHLSATTVDSGLNENQVTLRLDDQPVLSIYSITGENRENRAIRGNRIVIKRQVSIIYAGELLEGADDWGMDADGLRSHFNLIVESWTN